MDTDEETSMIPGEREIFKAKALREARRLGSKQEKDPSNAAEHDYLSLDVTSSKKVFTSSSTGISALEARRRGELITYSEPVI